MKILDKTILWYTLSIILFTILLVIIVVFTTIRIINSNIHNTYHDNNFIIDLEPKINKQLDKLTDIEGLNTTYNKVNITNNNNDVKTYQILLTPINDNEKDIRLCIDNFLIRDLSSYNKNNNKYIIYEGQLEPGFSKLHQIKMWQNKASNVENLKVNFKIEIKV